MGEILPFDPLKSKAANQALDAELGDAQRDAERAEAMREIADETLTSLDNQRLILNLVDIDD